jgi:hypothetical protein
MTQADSVHSTPRTNTPIADHPNPPRPPTSQERGDELLRRWRLARAAALRMTAGELNPFDVLVDLLGGADFDHEILDPAEAARIILARLRDAGFEVVPASSEDRS